MAEQLRLRNFEEFAPTFKSNRQWTDRKKVIEQFLFPGYVFCRLNPEKASPVLMIRGVANLVGFGEGPVPIDDIEIERVRRMVNSGLLITPWPNLAIGQRVIIERGPLAGIEGVLESLKGVCRIVVSIDLLKRSVSAEIDRAWVRPIPPPQHFPGRSAHPHA